MRSALVLTCALAALASGLSCGGDDDDDAVDNNPPGGTDDDDEDGDTTPSAACAGGALAAGSYELALDVNGEERTYLIDIPEGFADAAAPLIVHWHYAGGSPEQQRERTGFSDLGKAEGFLNVYPRSREIDGAMRWENDDCDNADVDFAEALLAKLDATACFDAARLFIAGFSNGGSFTHRVAARFAATFAAAGVMAGGWTDAADCADSTPVSIAILHGDADATADVERAREARDFWLAHNDCPAEPAGADGCSLWTGCAEDTRVLYCEWPGIGHAWPTDEFNATTTLWEFFTAAT